MKNKMKNKNYQRIRKILNAMKSRCYNINNNRYNNYGKRGIIICEDWLDKEKGIINFYNWAMQNRI